MSFIGSIGTGLDFRGDRKRRESHLHYLLVFLIEKPLEVGACLKNVLSLRLWESYPNSVGSRVEGMGREVS